MTITIVNGASAPVTTYADGPGNPTQGGMCWAANSFTWWWFQINSANDATGNPGTHKVSAYYNSFASCGGDPAAGTWTYYGDSPNLDSTGAGTPPDNTQLLFRNARSMGAYNFANGTVDVCHLACGIFMASSAGGAGTSNAIWGNLRITLSSTSLLWGTFGCYVTDKFGYTDTNLFAAFAVGRGTDGRMHIGANILTDQLDAGVIASQDVDTGPTWTTGGRGTGNNASHTAVLTALSNETGMAANYGIMNDNSSPDTGFSTNKINTIDSGTQVTMNRLISAGGFTGAVVMWTNFTPGTRTNLIVDSSMSKECNAYGFATLDAAAMLMVYDNGAISPQLQDLHYRKGSGAISAGFWPADNTTGDGSVFGTNVTNNNNDWCSCGVSTTAIYCARRTGNTTCEVRNYVTGSNTWQAITNAPPTMTGKTIRVGGGVCLVSDGVDMWLVVIDSTDAQIKYTKYTHGSTTINGTWGAWTNLAAATSTDGFMTAVISNGYLTVAFSEKNADTVHYDSKVASLSVGPHSPGPPQTPSVFLWKA